MPKLCSFRNQGAELLLGGSCHLARANHRQSSGVWLRQSDTRFWRHMQQGEESPSLLCQGYGVGQTVHRLWPEVGGIQNVSQVVIGRPAGSMRAHGENGTRGISKDLFCHRAQQQLSQSLTAAGANHDEVNLILQDQLRERFRTSPSSISSLCRMPLNDSEPTKAASRCSANNLGCSGSGCTARTNGRCGSTFTEYTSAS